MGKARRKKKIIRDPPTLEFPYRISRRLNVLSRPLQQELELSLPAFTPYGVRVSALNAHISDRIVDAAWPQLSRLRDTRRTYKNKFSEERLRAIDRMIEAANATFYAKLSNVAFNMKAKADVRKKRGWTDADWKKHLEILNKMSTPRRSFDPGPVDRGELKPLVELLPSMERLAVVPLHRRHVRLSQDPTYRDPTKVSPNAMKYVLTEHTKRLAKPRTYEEK